MTTAVSNRLLFFEATLGRSAAAMTGGAAAIVLSILGLAGIFPMFMLSVATLAIGVAFLFKGTAVAADYTKALKHTNAGKLEEAEFSGGMSAEMLAGAAGIVLGILALLSILPMTLGACALIAFGGAQLMSSGVTHRLNQVKIAQSGADDMAQQIATEATTAANGSQVLVGMAASVLGILSLIGLAPTTLALVGLLSLGGVNTLTGSALGTKMVHMFRA